MTQMCRFEVSDYLNSEEDVIEYLTLAIADENPDAFIAALGHAMRARGLPHVAEVSGLTVDSLYELLKPGSKRPYETVQKILHALGCRLTVKKAVLPAGSQ